MRQNLILAASTLVPLLLVSLGAGPSPATESPSAPPDSPSKPVTDRYFDVEVTDGFRWLEDWTDPAVRTWSERQNGFARFVLDGLPGVAALRDRVRTIARFPSSGYSSIVRRGKTFFAIKNQPPRQQSFLVILASPDDPAGERAVVDPNAIDPRGGTAIDWFVPSFDGRLVAVSLSEGGSEAGSLRVYETATGRALADAIPRVNGGTAGGDVAWNGDGTGFFYTRYPREGERATEDLDFYQQVYFHKLGAPTADDVYAVGKEFPRIAETTLESSEDGRFVLASVKNGDGGDESQYLRTSDGKWVRLAGDAERVVDGRFASDGSLYLLSRLGAPRGRILHLAAGRTDLSSARVVVPEGEGSIESFCLTANRIYLQELVGGPSRLRVVARDGQAIATLPILPTSSVSDLAPAGDDAILFQNQSALVPPAWFRASAEGKVEKTALVRQSPVDFADCEIVREWAVSKDGTRVPIDVLRRKGTKLDGDNPTLLYGYGGYAISQRPAYSAMRRVWLEQGGVLAVAGLRGGGEFGDDWHRAGHRTRKQNVFDDFAACARRLIELGYTKPARLGIEGGSNGGLLDGRRIHSASRPLRRRRRACRHLRHAAGRNLRQRPVQRDRVRNGEESGGVPRALRLLAVPPRESGCLVSAGAVHDRRQ